MALEPDEQALLLLTNRLLLDWISIAIDQGHADAAFVGRLIDFSRDEVIRGAPWLEPSTAAFAELFKSRLPRSPSGS